MTKGVCAAALLAALPVLSGCVAAAALPVLAAGGVIKSRSNRAAPRVATPAMATAPSAQTLATPSATRGEPAAVSAIGQTRTLDDGTRVTIVGTALPAPGGSLPAVAGSGRYAAFADWSAEAASGGGTRRSALLADPGSLDPSLAPCPDRPPAVLMDLDPGAGLVNPDEAERADPALVSALAQLRAKGIAVAWISGNTPDRTGAVRRALLASGLDPVGRDELLLPVAAGDSKQDLRAAFARQYCVVALAGDERSDFDDLFLYLKDPALAAPLAALDGKGWFVIPAPLSSSQGN